MNQINGIESDNNRSGKFWIAYVLTAFQFGTNIDFDPNSEILSKLSIRGVGVTPGGAPKLGSLVFREHTSEFVRIFTSEFVRIFAPPETPTRYRSFTVAHEIGHQFLLSHDNGRLMGGLTRILDVNFHPKDLGLLRARVQSPGK